MMGVRSAMIGAGRLSLIVMGAMSLVTGLGGSGLFLHTFMNLNFYQTYCAIRTNRYLPVKPGDLAIGPKDKYVEIIRKYFTDAL